MRKIRSDTLKIMAIILMIVDHVGIAIVGPYRDYMMTVDYDAYLRVSNIYDTCRIFGRIAFPIFAYQIAVGMTYTKNRFKYLRNLFLFAFISEIPYDVLFSNKLLEATDQNVFFTLFFGSFAICTSELIVENLNLDTEGKISFQHVLVMTAVTVACASCAKLLKTDYDAKGVILIVVMYVLLSNRILLGTLGPIIFVADIFLLSLLKYKNLHMTMQYCSIEIYALLAFPFILADSGKRTSAKWFKWMGYISYPAHIVVIYLVKMLFVHY